MRYEFDCLFNSKRFQKFSAAKKRLHISHGVLLFKGLSGVPRDSFTAFGPGGV